ncbi:aldo/keto reductase [Mucilaginibacter myungsuensis]|uniref:Aldo/keto reductase n=1 Tax=Mucilaginibacter myungsuensis TaxID=649104 RepID=A0A929L1H6_9SPHI|nr:aldo/keto reductase [Mucilaginibacter myungsuensis]MBE9664408.1 aldo/keto reductase [Mucilaginibacter myungsuensis]MDN3597119.1 aldo/keto reductase [Mucilaginibacter myungsuensis]
MNKRQLGKTSINVSPLMFGGNVFGWTIDQATSFKILDAFIDAGLNFIDTADVYSRWVQGNSGGESETIIGNWLKASGKRDQIVLATKVGKEMGEGKKGLSARYIKQAVEASLCRLRTDYIDLYQSHDDDKETSFEETLEAYSQLITEGKVRVIGASNYTADRLAEALQVGASKSLATYQTLQPEYNLYAREDYETNLEHLCLDQGLGVVPFYSLASGFLTGKYRSEADFGKSKRGGVMGKYLNDRGVRILDALDKVADQYNTSQASVALAWLIARPSITAPIASATSLAQLQDLVKATELNLSDEAVTLLTEASSY